jgi:hypothetical protein
LGNIKAIQAFLIANIAKLHLSGFGNDKKAVREVLAANAQLLVLARQQRGKRR